MANLKVYLASYGCKVENASHQPTDIDWHKLFVLEGEAVHHDFKRYRKTDKTYGNAIGYIDSELINNASGDDWNGFLVANMVQPEIPVIFCGVDYWNRPVFKDNRNNYFGDTDRLYTEQEINDDPSILQSLIDNGLTFFGREFGCEPMGTPIFGRLVLVNELVDSDQKAG